MAVNCPSCSASMTATSLASHIGTPVEIDVCWSCHLIWFDHLESTSLSAQSVMDFFRLIHERRADSRNIVSLTGKCPVCHDALRQTNDVTRTGRFAYFRCPQGHGRLISFVQFLREKSFVRTLSPVELTALSAKVRQIRCSSCGAGVDIVHDTACTHCGAPVSVLDENAVAAALAELDAKVRRPVAAIDRPANQTYAPRHDPPRTLPVDWQKKNDSLDGSDITDLLLTGLAAVIAASLD